MAPGIAWVAREASAAAAALARGRRRRAGAGAHRLGAAHRRRTMSAPRRSSTGCSTATASRPLSFWIAGHLLRRRGDDAPVRIRRGGGDPVHRAAGVLRNPPRHERRRHLRARAAGSRNSRCRSRPASPSPSGSNGCAGAPAASSTMSARSSSPRITLAAIVIGLGFVENPLVTDAPVGGPFLNLILLGYGLPAVLAIVLALVARRTRPMPYRVVSAAVSVALALAYLTPAGGAALSRAGADRRRDDRSRAIHALRGLARLRRGAAGRRPAARTPSRRGSRRRPSSVLTIAKVFLVDMSDLTGIWRALSFIGLGLVLVGIGYLYQRLLFPPRRPAQGAGSPDLGT